MMPSTRRSHKLALALVLALVSMLLAGAGPATGDDPDETYFYEGGQSLIEDSRATYVANEYIIHVLAGTPLDMVKSSVERMGATLVRKVAVADTYLIRLGRSNDVRSPRYVIASTKANSQKAAASGLSAVAGVPWIIDRIQPNVIYRPCAEPVTDPLWVDQWNLDMINMPGAWSIEKGKEFVTVAVLDTGVAYRHPDLIERCIQGYDTFDQDNDPFDTPPGNGVGHGTHVAGIIAAQGDNSEGICGVAWEGVKIMPVRVLGPVDDDQTAGTTETVTAGMEYALTHGAHVVNMSLGAPARTGDGIYRTKIAQLAQSGVVVVVASGNEGTTASPYVGVPAIYPEVIAVGSVGDTEEIADYSSYGPAYEVDIAAPGGQMYLNSADELVGGIWSTYIVWEEVPQQPGWYMGFYGYAELEGTSMACPHVAGAAALLLSQGVPAAQVRSRLLQTAREPKQPILFDRYRYGAGILDVQAALANASIKIVKPGKGSTVGSSPDFEVNWRGVDTSTIRMYVDYVDDNADGVPDNPSSETPLAVSPNPLQTSISFKWSDVSTVALRSDPGSNPHNMYVSAESKVGGSFVSDYVTFSVSDRNIKGGLHLFSLPFVLDTTQVMPSDVLPGTDYSLMNPERSLLQRFLTSTSWYETFVPGNSSDRCWINPMYYSSMPTGGGYYDLVRRDDSGRELSRLSNQYAFPAGAGFWLALPPQTTVPINESLPTLENMQRGDGYVFDAAKGFRIRLYRGWNMIGNPYTHSVSWRGNLRVTYQGETKSLQEAAESGWIQGILFRYKTTGTPGYDRLTDRDNLEPYQGYWIRALVGSTLQYDALTLTVLP